MKNYNQIIKERNMSDLNDLTASTDNIERIRDNELLQIYKLELILSIIKQLPTQQFNVPEKENLLKAISIFSVQNYLKLNDDLTLLDLESCKGIDISYTERKAVLNCIKEEIPNRCAPIINYIKDIQKEWPDIFREEQKHNEILALEEKRQKLHEALSEIKHKKLVLLQSCAELKIGPYLKHELNLRYLNYKLNQNKANALKAYLVNEFCSSTNHTMKAIKEVTKYIEEELNE